MGGSELETVSWTSDGLPVIAGSHATFWSTRGAALVLCISAENVRDLIRASGMKPAGKRYEPGFGTRHVPVYAAAELVALVAGTCVTYLSSV